jgi:Fe-S cluster biogenesis protein NfuA
MTEIEITENIEKALAEIRPFLNSDGGDISLVEVLMKTCKSSIRRCLQVVV